MRSMPVAPMSSSRPIKGETNVAPAFAANIACAAEKQSVTFTMVNVTLCFSAAQAILAAKAGATFVSPFIGRLDDIGATGMDLIGEIVQIYRQYSSFKTEVLV